MSDLIIKKNGTDYKLPMLAEHFPADRVYLNGDIHNTVQDALSYSTTEKIVGTWVDGSPIYKKTIDVGTLPNATTKGVNHNISNLDRVLKVEGEAKSTSIRLPLPFVGLSGDSIGIYIDNTKVNIIAGGDASYYTGSVTLYYTKTT